MEIRQIDPAHLTIKGAIELADVALDAFRNDPLYLSLNMHYGDKYYARQRLSYALLLAAKLWRRDVRAWVAVEDGRVIGFCRWEKLPDINNGVCGVWIWIANTAKWLVDLYASITEPPESRPLKDAVVSQYFADVSAYFDKVAPVPPSFAYLGLLCARESCKGRGIGSSLLSASMLELESTTPTHLRYSLWSTAAGLGLYKKHGFQVRAEHNAYLNGRQQRQILMIK